MVTASMVKGVVVAVLVVGILHHHDHLSVFEQGLIIATVSATITGVFTLLGAWLAVRAARPVHDDILAVKGKVDADRRESD